MSLLGKLLVSLGLVLSLLGPVPASVADDDWVFYTQDRTRYSSPWYRKAHRIMIPFGCTRAPYYAPDPRCAKDRGFHHGLDIAMPCGTLLRSARWAWVVSNDALGPRADDRPDFEQPGCLHAGMDLYKHAFRLSPMVPSDLVADCFELARDIRVLDMRAAPYDLTDLGFEPVAIETTAGKAAYVEAQRGFAERGAPLRARLIEECERLLAAQNS